MSLASVTDVLDAWILAENKIVTYKLLSRLLRIKANDAKVWMAQWHKNNPRIHATYVIHGLNMVTSAIADESLSQNSLTNNSATKTSQIPQIESQKSSTVRLVAQEDLETAKSDYRVVTSCHIYSLEPSKLSDIGILSSVRNDIRDAMIDQSSKISYLAQTYGVIFNDKVHQFEQNSSTTALVERTTKPIFKPEINSQDSNESAVINAAKGSEVSKRLEQPLPSLKKVPSLKRNASSSLASAFAKTQKPKPKPVADRSMGVTKEEDTAPQPVVEIPVSEEETRPASDQQRNAELHDMMMAEDEKQDTVSKDEGIKDAEMQEVDDWSASDTEMKESIPAPAIQPPRRRTKKKVKKQVHTKDAQGYIVTKEEWEWISCDEDPEPATSTGTTLSRQNSVRSINTKVKPPPKKKAGSQAGIANYFAKR